MNTTTPMVALPSLQVKTKPKPNKNATATRAKKETINENFQMSITIVSWHEHRSIYKVMHDRQRVIHCNRPMLYLTSLLMDCREKMSRISSEVSILGIPMRGKYFSGSFYTRLVLFLHILCVPSRSKFHILELCGPTPCHRHL
jgi:hypothetical protein